MPRSILTVATRSRDQMIDITSDVQRIVRDSGIVEGVVTVFCPHTTAAVTINENADPDVQKDVLTYLGSLIPREAQFRHTEGNADSHIKTILTGPSVQVIIEGGWLLLGTWQGLYLCEFDGPRRREVWVRVGP